MKSLRWRLVVLNVLTVIVVMIVSGTLIVTMLKNSAYNTLDSDLKKTVKKIIKDIDKNKSLKEIQLNLINSIKGLESIEKSKYIYLLDKNRRELHSRNDDNKIFKSTAVIAAANGNIITKVGKSYSTEYSGELIEYREYAEPININNEVEFIVYIKMSTKPIKKDLQDTVFIIFISVIIALVLAVILGIILSKTVSDPIEALTSKAREMALGNLNNYINVNSDDEIGQLTQNFNIMAKALNKTISEVKSEKNKLETVFSHMTDGILVFDNEGVLTHYNPASEKLLIIDKDIKHFNTMFQTYLKTSYKDLMKNIKQDIVQHILNTGEKYVNVCFARFANQDDEEKEELYGGIICVLQDITQHKKLEEMQKEFVANVSHELRTPITTIKSYAETLLDGALEDREISENFLDVINYESDRMTNLVQDLLDLSRLDNKQTKFVMQQMNLSYVVEESINKYQIHAIKKNQKMIFHQPNKIFKIYGDTHRIEQVVKNIISNAVKYSPENATIDIKIYEENNSIIVKVKDTGMGIPREDIPRIFERFYRVDKARSRAMGGTGLGLAIAKEIMEFHGGTINVESELGKGTCFYMVFKP